MYSSNPSSSPGPWHGVPLALLLGLILAAASFSRIAGDMNSMAFQHRVITSVLSGPIWGTAFGRNIAVYSITVAVLHCLFALLCLFLARASRSVWPSARVTIRQWLLIWFLSGAGWVLIANATLFPNSSLGGPYARTLRTEWLGVTPLAAATSALVVAALAACVPMLLRLSRKTAFDRKFAFALGTVILCGALFGLTPADVKSEPPRSPHVILIGLDSLRPDAVSGHTEAIAGFLAGGTTFSDAITPLARTFPAWVATLTGRHPHTTGAMMNLLPRDLIDTGETLPEALRRAGYATAYAIDEVRFSNIDETYGFDTVIAPPMGATEFLLSSIIDTPLSNLVMNTWLGAVAFPHLHANRGAAATYDPDTFVRRLASELHFDRPTFAAVHLTLAHWPFTWADEPRAPRHLVDQRARRYEQAVVRLDEQFQDVMEMLDRKGALENAIVIVMSDHGEALGFETDTAVAPDQDRALVNINPDGKFYGHGTSILSPPQYQVLLSMRTYGAAAPRIGKAVIDSPVSLEDVMPTIVDLLDCEGPESYDGRSLAPLLASSPGARDSFDGRIRFTETEFNPQDVFVGGEISASGVAKAASFYRLDPVTDRVELRPELLSVVIQHRQYGAIMGDELLAALPAATGGYKFVALDRRRGFPRLVTTAPSGQSDTAMLWRALHERFDLVQVAPPGT